LKGEKEMLSKRLAKMPRIELLERLVDAQDCVLDVLHYATDQEIENPKYLANSYRIDALWEALDNLDEKDNANEDCD